MLEFIEKLAEKFPRPIEYFKSIWLQGGPSVSRIVTVMACATLCYATILLAKAIPPDSMALGVTVTGLTGLVGYAYGRGRTSEERKAGNGDVKDDSKPTDL